MVEKISDNVERQEELKKAAKTDVKLASVKSRNDLANSIEKYANITSKESLSKLPSNEIVSFVLKNPEKSFKFFFKPTDSLKTNFEVDFSPIAEELLGLGHFPFFTEKNRLWINNVEGFFSLNASKYKPGYVDKNNTYLPIYTGSIIRLGSSVSVENTLEANNQLIDNQAKIYPKNLKTNNLIKERNELYVKALEKSNMSKREKIFLPKISSQYETLESNQLSSLEAHKKLSPYFNFISSSGDYKNRLSPTATTLEGLRYRTVRGLEHLCEKFVLQSKLRLTGGTEIGHSERGEHTHGRGFKVDVGFDKDGEYKKIIQYAQSQPSFKKSQNSLGNVYTFKSDDFTYKIIHEKDHLDIQIT